MGHSRTPPIGFDYVVAIDSLTPCWLSDVDGDPGRTLDPARAKRFGDFNEAQSAMGVAAHAYPTRLYRIDTLLVMVPGVNSAWKAEYEAEYARVFGKRIKLVGGRNGYYKMKPDGGQPARSGYRQLDILRMTQELKARLP